MTLAWHTDLPVSPVQLHTSVKYKGFCPEKGKNGSDSP